MTQGRDGTETILNQMFSILYQVEKIFLAIFRLTKDGQNSEAHTAQLNRGLITLVNICLNTTIIDNNIGGRKGNIICFVFLMSAHSVLANFNPVSIVYHFSVDIILTCLD